VIDDVSGLFVDSLVALLTHRAHDLCGLLLNLCSGARSIVEQLDSVGPGRPLERALGERPLERRQHLVRSRRLELAAVKAGALARVAGRTGGLNEGEHRVAVAVDAQRAHGLRVAARRTLVPELIARATPEVKLAGLAGPLDRAG